MSNQISQNNPIHQSNPQKSRSQHPQSTSKLFRLIFIASDSPALQKVKKEHPNTHRVVSTEEILAARRKLFSDYQGYRLSPPNETPEYLVNGGYIKCYPDELKALKIYHERAEGLANLANILGLITEQQHPESSYRPGFKY